MKRLLPILTCAALVAGCGGSDAPVDRPPITKEPAPLPPGQAQPAAAASVGTLVRIPDSAASRTRLGYVNADALASTPLPVGRARVVTAVLGEDARPDRVLVGSQPVRPGTAAPPKTAMTDSATSATQVCLGDTLAQTLLGPRTMGYNAALGVGLTRSPDAPAGLKLRICGAPHLARDLHDMEKTLERRLPRGTVVGDTEVNAEREIVSAAVAVRGLAPRRLLGLLSGGAPLRALAWR